MDQIALFGNIEILGYSLKTDFLILFPLTPKGPRLFFYKKTLKTAISIAKSKKIKIFFSLHICL